MSAMPSDLAELPKPNDDFPVRCARSGNTGKALIFFGDKQQGESGDKQQGKSGELCYPVLVAEGFPGAHELSYLLPFLRQHDFMQTLLRRGYDLVLIQFDQGTDRIQNNAGVIEDAIRKVHTRTNEELVLIGLSMGGLVARYALTRMEHEARARREQLERTGQIEWPESSEHRVRCFITWDTPHRGAYTSLAVQWFVHAFRDAHPALKDRAKHLDSAANQQFMRQWLNRGQVIVSPLRAEFLDDLRQLGNYPKKCRRIAVSSGPSSGTAQYPSHEKLFEWKDDQGNAAELWSQGEREHSVLIAQGQRSGQALPSLHHASAYSAETVPGGQGGHLKQVAALAGAIGGKAVAPLREFYCAVPSYSALDLDPGHDPFTSIHRLLEAQASPFDAWKCSGEKLPHLVLSRSTLCWLLNQIEAFDPHDPAYLRDPYPTYRRLRRTVGVLKVKPYKSWWVFREADLREALGDRNLSDPSVPDSQRCPFRKDPPPGTDPLTLTPADVMANLPEGPFHSDPPWHTRLRDAIDPLFAEAIKNAAPLAQQIAGVLLDRLPQAGSTDLVSSYALPLPAAVLFRVLGTPNAGPQQRDDQALITWVTLIANAHDQTQSQGVRFQGLTSALALGAYYQALMRGGVVQPVAGGLIERLVKQAPSGLSLDELQSSLVSLTVAGYLSTTFLICTGLRHLQRNPSAVNALMRDDAESDRRLMNELLRLDAPAQIVDRRAWRDLQLSGVQIRKGDKLALILGSGNYDADVFKEPDRLNLERCNGAAHLSFGDGLHRCIGESLPRIVTPIALRELLRCKPNLVIDGLVQWQTDPYLRGPSNLPVRWG